MKIVPIGGANFRHLSKTPIDKVTLRTSSRVHDCTYSQWWISQGLTEPENELTYLKIYPDEYSLGSWERRPIDGAKKSTQNFIEMVEIPLNCILFNS